MKHIITYDLCKPGQNYSLLANEITSIGQCIKINQSCWVVKSNLTAIQIRNRLTQFTDRNDSLIIIPFNFYAACGLDAFVYAWLNT